MTQTEPLSPAASFEQAIALYQSGQTEAALTLCQAILAVSPDFFDCLHLAGVLSTQAGQLEQGLDFLDRAIRLKPHVQLTYANRFLTLQKLQRPEEALASLDQAIELLPENPSYWISRAQLLLELKRLDEALESFIHLCTLQPDSYDAHFQRGRVLKMLGQTEQALAAYDQTLRLNPDFSDAWNNRGNIFCELGQHETALVCFDEAIRSKPEGANSYRWNKSLVLLLRGQFAEGWRLYELRGRAPRPLLPEPWLGEEEIAGQTIFLYTEQGLGDAFQFCRYTRLLKARGATVILEVPEHLRRVLSGLSGVDHWVSSGESSPPFNMHCPLMSLPLACKTFSEKDIPADIPYLFADPVLAGAWGKKLGKPKRPRVGIVWNVGFRPDLDTNKRRNIPFALMARLNHPDIDFYSLQKGEPAESELLHLKDEHWPADNFHIHTTDIHDFADTAALISHLDLVIAVDTAVMHLAAALGKPVWVLNRFDTEWRWMLEREDSPWYPTLKIYRQKRLGEWDDVIERVRADLNTLSFAPAKEPRTTKRPSTIKRTGAATTKPGHRPSAGKT